MHEIKNLVGQFLRHVTDNISGIIRGHFLQDFSDGFFIELFQKLCTHDVVEFGQDIGAFFYIFYQVEENSLLFEIEVTKKMGNVSRVRFDEQFGQITEGPAPDQAFCCIMKYLLFLIHG